MPVVVASQCSDGLQPRVNLRLEAWRSTGELAGFDDLANAELVFSTEIHNIVPLTGRNLIRDCLHWLTTADGTQPTGLNRFAVGTSSSGFGAASTRLNNEVFRDSWTARTKTDGQTVYKYFLGTGSANANTLVEAGIFGNGATTAANNGTLYSAATHSSIAKTTAIGITYTWTLTWVDDGV